ncbi:unnamed protein product [Oreochromis niloticus]|nr:unnamed protein product [Mustela putorius furo]
MDLLSHFRCQELGTYATVIGIFTYIVLLHRDMPCTCKDQTKQCNEYMALPFVLVFFIMLFIDKTFRRTTKHGATFLCIVIKRTIKASLIGLLWVVAVFIDGDWYVCCKIDEVKKMLPCKKKENLTSEEFAEITDLKNTSQIIGYSLLLAVIVAAFLTSCGCGWRKCCEKKFSCCSRKTLYYRLILEEEKKALDVLLRKAAKENLTKEIMTKIKKNDWDGCFNVAQEMINKAKQQKMAARNEDISKESTKTGEPAQQGTRSAHHEGQNIELQSVTEDSKPLFDESD